MALHSFQTIFVTKCNWLNNIMDNLVTNEKMLQTYVSKPWTILKTVFATIEQYYEQLSNFLNTIWDILGSPVFNKF